MDRRTRSVCFASAALVIAGCRDPGQHTADRKYSPPVEAQVTYFAAATRPAQTLVIEAATDVSFMRPFILQFLQLHPNVAITYEDMLSTALLSRASRACRQGRNIPDLYVSVATDHLVRLANDGCAQSAALSEETPAWREWRHEVFAFALEPAVFVYNRTSLPPSDVPRSHLALVDQLRVKPDYWSGRIGTYDIRKSGIAFNYADFDARESSLFGRLIEGLGRSKVRLYCCSNEMVDAVRRGSVLLAYNVQLSYALAAQKSDAKVGIVVPSDYQAIQTRSVMIPAAAPNVELASAFIDYLLSTRGKRIEADLLTSAAMDTAARFTPSDRLMNQANVSSALLRLQDTARREALIREWEQAIAPAVK